MSIRDEDGHSGDILSLFHRVGIAQDLEMSFDAELIVPKEGLDDLGQPAAASITFLRYGLSLAYRKDETSLERGRLEVVREELSHITLGDAPDHLKFPKTREWLKTAITGARRSSHFISTVEEGGQRVIKLHQDKNQGRPISLPAPSLVRTVLSSSRASESPTATLARNEMRAWRLLHLEPTALRKPDRFLSPRRLGADGSHLASALYSLAHGNGNENGQPSAYSRIANRLAELISGVKSVGVDRDEKRELLTLFVTGMDGTPHPARSLSDGTLRFLALSVLELDQQEGGLFCLEEPENGIHPERIPSMLRLLEEIATDPEFPLSADNPLRQVIVNTHSPAVVGQVSEQDLLMADERDTMKRGVHFRRLALSCLPGTWRAKTGREELVSRAQLIAYLSPILPERESHRHRVADRDEVQFLLPFREAV